MPQLHSAATSQLPTPTDVKKALGDVSQRAGNLGEASWVAGSCLVAECSDADPSTLRSAVVMSIFDRVLDLLEKESPDWAAILRQRFWEGKQAQAMIMKQEPRPWSESYFFEQQNLAIERFTAILNELESQCRSLHSKKPEINSPPQHVFSVLVGALVILIFTLAWSSLRPSKSDTLGHTAADALSPTATPHASCGEKSRATAPAPPVFLRSQGVSSFTSVGTGGHVQNNKVRAVAIDKRGLWAGFFASESSAENGLSHFDKQTWANCDSPDGTDGKDINDIVIDPQGRVWAAAEKKGVAMYDGSSWRAFTEKDGLPSADTFGLAIDPQGRVWVATWNGVATFDGSEWSTPYTTQNETLSSDHTGSIAFDSTGDVWVGLLRDGVNRFRHADGSWEHLTKQAGQIVGNEVRSILVRQGNESTPESVWIATNDGGISTYERGVWSHHTADSGLPSNSVNDLALDRYNRIWAVTSAGVSYYTGEAWVPYTTLPSLSIALGPDCTDCPYDNDHVIVGTVNHGITHSRIPLDTDAIEVVSVSYPSVVSPGETFIPEITIAPKAPYKLTDARGDFLSNTDEDDSLLFGTHEHIAVKGTINYGAQFVFREPNLPFVAPVLPDGINERSFTSSWRMWMHTRYVGPPIHITFTVRR